MRTMLFDFYGDLLTEKQREYYDLHFNSDLSLQEIAEQSGVSRQAVWDIIRRAEQSLFEIEEKTGLVSRAVRRRKSLEELEKMISLLPEDENKAEILRIIEELND
ncbi:MAG: winged helix-turn-helix transcriptional regulator [Ruminococcaceae bacterium]|nr:winged helix-turn-helix transcriptional regulator [Oscillospiraceae bacterium]